MPGDIWAGLSHGWPVGVGTGGGLKLKKGFIFIKYFTTNQLNFSILFPLFHHATLF